MRIKDLQAQKSRLVTEMRSLADKPENNGDLSAEQEQRFTTLKSDVEAIEKRIERQTFLDEIERQTETVDPVDYQNEVRNFSIVRAIAGAAGMDVDAGREKEISQELAKRHGRKAQGIFVPIDQLPMESRAITTTLPIAGPGSNITPVDYRPGMFIDALRAKLVIRQLGCTVLSGLTGKLEVPKLKAAGTGYWVAENTDITAADQQFEKVDMVPRHAGALTELSRQMLLQSSPDVEQLVKNDFSALMANAVDLAAINGAGSGSNQPLGIFGTTGVNTVDVSGGWTWAKILGFIEEVQKDHAEGNAWLTRAEVVKTFRSTVKETAVHYADAAAAAVSADYLMSGPRELAGYPLASTQNVPANQICFGNWADLLLGMFGPLDVLVNPYESSAYKKGNVMVRMMLACDVTVRHPESFCIATL